ncbi:MAG: DNA-binding protein [Acidobacteria bacterium]|nr:MAG: DNA-binding protein [Acidobacteriota bacterium]
MSDVTALAARPDLAKLHGRATISVEETAKVLGIGRTAAYEAARRGELPTRRLGRRVLVPVPALLEWLGATRSA